MKGGTRPGAPAARSAETAPDVNPGGPLTTGEKIGNLERELERSLSEFDGLLLRERQLLQERREGGGAPGTGAEGSERDGEEGMAPGPGLTAGGEGDVGDLGDDEAGPQATSEDGEMSAGDDSGRSRSAGRRGMSGESPSTPPDIPNRSDDDVVARQLREAAEQERDPELKARLWDEYRRYKGLPARRREAAAQKEQDEQQE